MFFLSILLSYEPNNIDLPLKSPFELKEDKKSKKKIEDKDNNLKDNNLKNNNLDSDLLDKYISKWLPRIQGEIPYSSSKINRLLTSCKKTSREETLNSCAAKLNA